MSDLVPAIAGGCAGFGVFEHDENFPLIAVGVAGPCLILQCVAAIDLHLVDGQKPGGDPAFARLQNVIGGCDLNAQVR